MEIGLTGDSSPDREAAEALWRRWIDHRDVRARNRLILTYAPMVKFLATRKLRDLPDHCEMDDLVSSGLVALIGAFARFDPARGVSFEAFAWIRVSGAIVDELRRMDWAPRSLRQRERVVNAARRSFQDHHGRAPSDEELASQLGVTVCDLRRHVELQLRADLVSLNAPSPRADDSVRVELGDSLQADAPDCEPELSALRNERVAEFRRAVASLTDREQQVLSWTVVDELRGEEIAQILGVSPSRVSQLLSDIRRKLKTRLGGYDSELLAA